jgi:hypothetical protein
LIAGYDSCCSCTICHSSNGQCLMFESLFALPKVVESPSEPIACTAPALQGGLRALGQPTDDDHSMLSGKPLGGYRCMACDRPLSTLNARPGPHLPTGQLPVSLASWAELMATAGAALGKVCRQRASEASCTVCSGGLASLHLLIATCPCLCHCVSYVSSRLLLPPCQQ